MQIKKKSHASLKTILVKFIYSSVFSFSFWFIKNKGHSFGIIKKKKKIFEEMKIEMGQGKDNRVRRLIKITPRTLLAFIRDKRVDLAWDCVFLLEFATAALPLALGHLLRPSARVELPVPSFLPSPFHFLSAWNETFKTD